MLICLLFTALSWFNNGSSYTNSLSFSSDFSLMSVSDQQTAFKDNLNKHKTLFLNDEFIY